MTRRSKTYVPIWSHAVLFFCFLLTFSGVSLAAVLSFEISFDEGVYATNESTGALQASDLEAYVEMGTATNPVITTVTHTAGDDTATISISLTGNPDENESLTLSFLPDSAYDLAGNEANGNFTLTLMESAFIPDEIGGLEIWFDADDEDTLVLSGAKVTVWQDKSPYSRHAVQNAPARQPSYDATGFLGKPTIVFSGSNWALQHSAILSSDYTAFYILRPSESAVNLLYYYHAGNINGGNLGFVSESKFTVTGWGSISGGAVRRSSSTYPTPLTSRLHVHTPNKLFQTGSEVVYAQQNSAAGGGLTDIGSRSDNTTLFYKGTISEIIVYNSILSDSDRQKVEGYLAHKWGLAGDLPVAHPYKVSGP